MAEELKPCPFCGGAATKECDPLRWRICCRNDDCKIKPRTNWHFDEEKPITAWNTRT